MRILYAADGSPGALAAAALITGLALRKDDSILLLGVEPLPGENSEERLLASARAALDGVDVPIATRVRSGAPAAQILDTAREENADLVVVGATGATGIARFFMGSVAERVLRHAEAPVLVARPVRHGLKRALAAVDSSEVAGRVVETASRFPLPAQTELRLFTVLPPREAVLAAAPMVWAGLAEELDDALRNAGTDAESRLRELARIGRASGRSVSAEVGRGDPASCIIAAADQDEADMVILGSHGEGGMDRFLLGSVSERVARHARASVLVVR